MTSFDRAAALAHRAIDRVFGEPWRIEPRLVQPNRRSAVDPDRTAVEVTGIYIGTSARARADGAARGAADYPDSPGIALNRPVLDIAATALPWRPRPGDRVERLDTAERFDVAEIRPTTEGRLIIDLLILGSGA